MKEVVKVVVPGSFDPFTLGHLDIVTRAAQLFDEVIVAVGVNIGKQNMFTMDHRVEMALGAVSKLDNVSVVPMDGLLVDFCRAHGASLVVRGARSGADFDAEWAMATMNSSLADVETLILPAATTVGFISSTLIRSVARAGGDVAAYVPENVFVSMNNKEL
ncbi:MAG: pantetheine-phosphate adenylyltransferase [Propionibacteriaceae bacterium]|nr:pantetheine-phosphate adenylyltransferase [Propionibacteriaceae bacterium]